MATIGSNATVTSSFFVNDSTDNVGSAIKRISQNTSTKSSSSQEESSSSSSASVTFSRLIQANSEVSQAERELEAENQKIQSLQNALEAARRTREYIEKQRNDAKDAQANVEQENAYSLLNKHF